MEAKVCNKCGLEKNINSFEFRKDKNSYRNTCKECRYLAKKEYYSKNKEEINKRRRDNYQKNRDEINKKRRAIYLENKEEYNLKRRGRNKKINTDPFNRLKNQLKRNIDKSFKRKGFTREESYEEILGCSVDMSVENLLKMYKMQYKKEWDGVVEVNIDHLIPLKIAKTKDEVKKLCGDWNLMLLTREENHLKGGKIRDGFYKNGKPKFVSSHYIDDFFD